MASILDRYGIKEVADVTFYKINKDGTPGAPVLYLDTLKVSTIEQTAENTSARGGKGNPELIMWDYGKEITVNLEDALFSPKSLAMMYGVDTDSDDFYEIGGIRKTVPISSVYLIEDEDPSSKFNYGFMINGDYATLLDGVTFYNAKGEEVEPENKEEAVYATGIVEVNGQQITISSDKFPGTYYVIGDTYARSETTGQDEFFQFIIPKAKMQSEVTLTMEAEGDPSTFSMNMKVLRPANGEMMKLVKFRIPVVIMTGHYSAWNGEDSGGEFDWELKDDSAQTLTFTLLKEGENIFLNSRENPLRIESLPYSKVEFVQDENHYLTKIYTETFSGLKQIVDLKLPDTVSEISGRVFCKTVFKNLILPDQITVSDYDSGWVPEKVLDTFYLGNGVGSAISDTEVTAGTWAIGENNSEVYLDEEGALFDKSEGALIKFPTSKTGTYNITAPRVGYYAFKDCNLEKVSFSGDNEITIGYDCFKGSLNLKEVAFITSAHAYYGAFTNCPKLETVKIKEHLNCDFADCHNLKTIYVAGDENSYVADGAPWGAPETVEIIYNWDGEDV